jgi:hypothetical protein
MAREIGLLLDDPLRRRQLGERAQAWVGQRYTWSALIQTMQSFYEGLAGGTGSDRVEGLAHGR